MMLELSRFRRLLLYLVFYVLGVLVLIVGFSVPLWEVFPGENKYSGLWSACLNGSCLGWKNKELADRRGLEKDELPEMHYMVAQTVMSVGLVLTIVTGATYLSWVTQHKDHRLMVLTSICMMLSGLFCLAGVIVFALARTDSQSQLGLGYFCSVVSSAILLITGFLLIMDRCVFTANFEHHRVAYTSDWSEKTDKTKPQAGQNATINRAFSHNGSTNGFTRPPTETGLSTIAGQQSMPELNHMTGSQSQSYLLPVGLKQGSGDPTIGVADTTAQPWTAGSGQLF